MILFSKAWEEWEVKLADLYLKFGNKEPGGTGIPLLRPYYSYLLKLSSNVGLVEIYPWLAELLFASVCVEQNGTQGAVHFHPINVVSFLIDDQRKNIALSMGTNNAFSDDVDPFLGCIMDYAVHFGDNKDLFPRNFVVDTFGQFGNRNHFNLTPEECEADGQKYAYMWSSLVGAGNPMRMKERFTCIGRQKGIPVKTNSEEEQPSAIQLGELNCFVINSISSLYRTMGFRDAMLLVRAMLQDAVWKPNEAEEDSKSKEGGEAKKDGKEEDGEAKKGDCLLAKPGMLFAILNEGVFASDEIRYAETFFDGVFKFEKENGFVSVSIERFPLTPRGRDDTIPDYSKRACYTPIANERIDIKIADKKEANSPENGGGD